MIAKYKAVLILSLTLGLLMCQSCKQGCTDHKAYNYTPGAKQDDASCLYCDSTVYYSVNSNSNTYYDYTTGSPHQGSPVLYIYVTENLLRYTGNGCNLLGLNNTGSCTRYSFQAQLYNHTSSTMIVTGDFTTTTYTQTIPYRVSSVTIMPNGSTTIDIATSCENSSYFNFNLQNYTFQYL